MRDRPITHIIDGYEVNYYPDSDLLVMYVDYQTPYPNPPLTLRLRSPKTGAYMEFTLAAAMYYDQIFNRWSFVFNKHNRPMQLILYETVIMENQNPIKLYLIKAGYY